jgi:protein SCO1/2
VAGFVLIAAAQPARADDTVPPILRDVGFTQHLGAIVPPDLTFVDERAQTIRLGDFLGSKPVVLTLNDLDCPNLCPLMLDGLSSTLAGLPFKLGDDYRVVTVSINPRDTPVVAREVKNRFVWPNSKLGTGEAWHFLTGDPASVQQLARVVGFNFAYDAHQDQFAHPVGLVILSPDGRISRYLYGMDFSSRDLRFALIDASNRQIGSPTDQFLLTCYHYEATLGRYSGIALQAVRAGGFVIVALLFVGLTGLWWRDLRRGSGPNGMS